jgi:ribosomal protein S18 acetylase RimI-like enzyme
MIKYKINPEISVEDFIDILNRSGLGERRPVDDKEIINGMLEYADIIIAAYNNDKTVGIARAVTDYHYCCYLSDLAVDKEYQHQGIGKALISKLKKSLHKNCKIILLSAPAATEYYPKIGFEKHNSAWILK